jgi:hypothetical protein
MACKTSGFKSYQNIWDLLKRQVKARPQQLNITDLTRNFIQVWAANSQEYLHRYIISIRSRCGAVIAAAEEHITY